MKTFNLKRFGNLCKMQLKEFSIWDYLTPLLFLVVVSFLGYLTNTQDVIDQVVNYSITGYILFGLLYSVYMSFYRALSDKNKEQKMMLPATTQEKYMSIWMLTLIRLLICIASILLILCGKILIGKFLYTIPATKIEFGLSLVTVDWGMMLIALFLSAAIILQFELKQLPKGRRKRLTLTGTILAYASILGGAFMMGSAYFYSVFVPEACIMTLLLLWAGYNNFNYIQLKNN